MSEQIRYNFGTIAQGAGDLTRSSQDLTRILEDLKAYLRPLVSTWQGDAALAYEQHQRSWNAAQENLSAILRDIAVAVARGNDAMDATNRRAAASWG